MAEDGGRLYAAQRRSGNGEYGEYGKDHSWKGREGTT